jgi:hypothetical protein
VFGRSRDHLVGSNRSVPRVTPIRKEDAFINGGVTRPRLVLKPISGLAANDFPRDHFADRDGGGNGR